MHTRKRLAFCGRSAARRQPAARPDHAYGYPWSPKQIWETSPVVIREASIYDKKIAFDTPGHRVLVMRLWPRGIRRDAINTWLKDAAPSNALLDAYRHHGLPWHDFAKRYRAEITDERPHVLKQLKTLEQEHEIIWLLCHERIPPEEHCHRQLLKEMLDGM
jgi:uncharacterized protein YeaO (DUF488 family)